MFFDSNLVTSKACVLNDFHLKLVKELMTNSALDIGYIMASRILTYPRPLLGHLWPQELICWRNDTSYLDPSHLVCCVVQAISCLLVLFCIVMQLHCYMWFIFYWKLDCIKPETCIPVTYLSLTYILKKGM